jgi:hypothetical protein
MTSRSAPDSTARVKDSIFSSITLPKSPLSILYRLSSSTTSSARHNDGSVRPPIYVVVAGHRHQLPVLERQEAHGA